jgi:hypothetical protein
MTRMCVWRVDVNSEPDVLGTGVTDCVKVRIGYNYVDKPKATTHYNCIRICILGGCRVYVVRFNILPLTAVRRYGRVATLGWTGAWATRSTRAPGDRA